MSTVLYIKANAKPEGISRTFKISDAFIETYKKHHPDDEIVTLDLYKEGICFLTEENVMMHAQKPEASKDNPVVKYAYQFLNANKYVFAEPLWNLGIPAILKAYIDYVCVNTVTFKYTAEGAVGLCQGKRAVNITARGGEYSAEPFSQWEMGDRYLRTILGFMGITDYTTVAADRLDVMGQDIDTLVGDAVQKAQALAENF